MEKWIDSRIVYMGSIFSVLEGEIETDHDTKFPRQVVIFPDVVAVVAILNNQISLIKQFRISINKEIIELPAGKLEENENPVSCARRELLEEVGYVANQLELISEYYTAAGYSTEKCTSTWRRIPRCHKHNPRRVKIWKLSIIRLQKLE